MPKLLYQGHGSFRFTTNDGKVIYVDPYAGEGYDLPAEQMELFARLKIDYALFCGDGVYNMGPEEAAECARLIGAKHNILIHVKPGALFDRKIAEDWQAPNKLIIEPGEEIEL